LLLALGVWALVAIHRDLGPNRPRSLAD
jgi:hypothetical protein